MLSRSTPSARVPRVAASSELGASPAATPLRQPISGEIDQDSTHRDRRDRVEMLAIVDLQPPLFKLLSQTSLISSVGDKGATYRSLRNSLTAISCSFGNTSRNTASATSFSPSE